MTDRLSKAERDNRGETFDVCEHGYFSTSPIDLLDDLDAADAEIETLKACLDGARQAADTENAVVGKLSEQLEQAAAREVALLFAFSAVTTTGEAMKLEDRLPDAARELLEIKRKWDEHKAFLENNALALVTIEFLKSIAIRDIEGNRVHIEMGEPNEAGWYNPTLFRDRSDNPFKQIEQERDALKRQRDGLIIACQQISAHEFVAGVEPQTMRRIAAEALRAVEQDDE